MFTTVVNMNQTLAPYTYSYIHKHFMYVCALMACIPYGFNRWRLEDATLSIRARCWYCYGIKAAQRQDKCVCATIAVTIVAALLCGRSEYAI